MFESNYSKKYGIPNKYCVLEYSIRNLKNLFKSCSIATEELIENKLQSQYFETYFENIGAKTIVIEGDYLDEHYLEDYSEYYVKCFNKYQRECNKLHFFKCSFDKKYFESIFKDLSTNKKKIKLLQDNYLGFITLKKLPMSIIGYTCLNTYVDNSTRNFPVIREYKTHLFGIPLKIESLAYQEQDSVVAACATSSLWSMFHGTGILFQHRIPSPVEITKAATENSAMETRVFPNKSLTFETIAKAIKYAGLEPYKINIKLEYLLKASLYAYLKAGIPTLMGFELIEIPSNKSKPVGHAVAITGYNLDDSKPFVYNDNNLILKSSKIDKIYVHDDQVGPYARMSFEPFNFLPNWCLSTSWGRSGGQDQYKALPWALSIPLHSQIRIPLEIILKEVGTFDDILKFIDKIHTELLLSNNIEIAEIPTDLSNIEWDIYLANSSILKEKWLNKSEETATNISKILTKQMPRYIWCCNMLINKQKLLNIIFDATDIEQNLNIVDVVKYNYGFYNFLTNNMREIFENSPYFNENYFVRWFSSQSDYSCHLNK